jgi:hypothetical protein
MMTLIYVLGLPASPYLGSHLRKERRLMKELQGHEKTTRALGFEQLQLNCKRWRIRHQARGQKLLELWETRRPILEE